MHVALVYNQKKEDAAQQSISEDGSDPPSPGGTITQTSYLTAASTLSTPHVLDRYAEWDTAETIGAVKRALEAVHDVTLIEADENAYEKLRATRPDIVFNTAEGLIGVSREAQIPAMLEMLGIPYTGSDPLTLAICLDKSRTKEILSYHRIPTPKFAVMRSLAEVMSCPVGFPAIVKPLHEGSSKGIFDSSLVTNRIELTRSVSAVLEHYHEPALIEEYLEGREFTVALLGNGDRVTALPIVEIKFDTLPPGVNPIYSYEAKWIWDTSGAPLDIFTCPAAIPKELQRQIEELCVRAFSVLRCRDWCRIDVRLDGGGKPFILEVNPLPGILPKPEDNSCFPKAARAAGIGYDQLIRTVLTLAALRNGLCTPRGAAK